MHRFVAILSRKDTAYVEKGGNIVLPNIGIPSLILILLIALLIFGPKKLPEIGGAFGKTLNEFKKSTSQMMEDDPPEPEPERKEISEETTTSESQNQS